MATGLISQELDQADPFKTVSGYEADISEVNPETGTVAGQMNTLLSNESPFITRARTSATQYANSRGLVNTTIAGQAGETAAIDAALPIASQDANIFNTTRLTNQAAKNQGFQFNAGSLNQAKGQVFGANKALEGQRLAGTQALEQIGAGGEQTRLNIGAQTSGQMQVGQQQFGFASQLGAQEYQQRLGLMAQEFAQQKELTADQFAQQKAMTLLQGEIEGGLITTREQADARLAQLQGDIQSTLSAQAYEQALGTAAFAEQANARLATLNSQLSEQMAQLQANLQTGQIMPAEFEQRQALLQQQYQIQLGTMQKQSEISQTLAQLEANLQTGQIMPAQFEQQKALLQTQFQNSLALQTAQNDFATVLQQMKGAQATQLAQIEGSFKTLVQTSASASSLYQDITKQLTLIYSSPDMTEAQKAVAAGNIASMLESGLTIVGAIVDLNLAGLLNFGGVV